MNLEGLSRDNITALGFALQALCLRIKEDPCPICGQRMSVGNEHLKTCEMRLAEDIALRTLERNPFPKDKP